MTYTCPYCGKLHDSLFMADMCEALDIKNAEIDNIIYSFAGCTTNKDVNDLVNKNLDFLNDNPAYFKYPRNARRRINRIRREKAKSWGAQLN